MQQNMDNIIDEHVENAVAESFGLECEGTEEIQATLVRFLDTPASVSETYPGMVLLPADFVQKLADFLDSL